MAESLDVRWSDISQMDCEMQLFRNVMESKTTYSRIHLLSGVDLPLKSQDYIHDFFKGRKEEFISISSPARFARRIKYYHFFVRSRRKSKVVEGLRKLLIAIQIPFVNRLKSCPLPFAFGSNWCSLTMKAVCYLCDNVDKYRKYFTYSTSCDELYKQMILSSNPSFIFSSPLEKDLRYVKFNHQPSPKILTIEDYDALLHSNRLFARKFDLNVDKAIVYKITNNL